MTLSSEQFNLLTTKKESDKLELKVDNLDGKVDQKFDAVFEVLDTIVKKLDNIEKENVSNISAHTRINRDLIRVRDQSKIDSMEGVEQI